MNKQMEMIMRDMERQSAGLTEQQVPAGVSNRHVHLSQEAAEALFGSGYQLHKKRALSQPGQYAAEERIALIGKNGVIERVRVLGPYRSESQVEILYSDSRRLGIAPVIRESGMLDGTPGIVLAGPAGIYELKKGVIAAKRHIHVSLPDAGRLKLKDRDIVSVECGRERKCLLGNVVIRVSEDFCTELHLDLEEAAGCGITNGDRAKIIK